MCMFGMFGHLSRHQFWLLSWHILWHPAWHVVWHMLCWNMFWQNSASAYDRTLVNRAQKAQQTPCLILVWRLPPGFLKHRHATSWLSQPPEKKIRRPAGVSCGSCLFVVVLSVVSWSLSRLSHWRGFLPRLTWTHPPSSSSFRLHLSLRCGGLNSAHASLNTGLVLHILLSFRWLFPLLLFAIGLLRRFLYPILDSLAFAPNTFYTHNLSKYGLFQSLPQYGLFQNPCLHTCFGLNLNRGLNKTNVMFFRPNPLLHKEPLYTKSCFTQRAVLHKELFYTKLCSPQITQCFTQKPCSCWACARAVCSSQGSSHFYGSFFSLKPPTKQSIIGYMEVY